MKKRHASVPKHFDYHTNQGAVVKYVHVSEPAEHRCNHTAFHVSWAILLFLMLGWAYLAIFTEHRAMTWKARFNECHADYRKMLKEGCSP